MCFHSVEGITWFWLFRHRGSEYQLVLKAAGNGFSVLKDRNNGYRDIKTGAVTGAYGTTTVFRFDGTQYEEYEKKSEEAH